MATTENSTNKNADKDDTLCYSKLARDGILLLLNNKQKEAELLFKTYPESIQMDAGLAFAIFMDALMTFEDDKLQLALQTLKDLEKKCSAHTGWMRSVRTKVFGSDSNFSYADQLESQIILADSHIFVATLTFLQQDISGYFKGGWMLRKSYKLYQAAYNEILALYNDIVGENGILIKPNEKDLSSSEAVPASKGCNLLIAQNEEHPSSVIEKPHNEITTDAQEEFNLDNTCNPQDSNSENPDTSSPIHEGPKATSPNDLTDRPTSSVQYKNGYITPCHLNNRIPKHSISCHDNLCSASSSNIASFEKYTKNGFIKDRTGHCPRNAISEIRPFMKKSTSLHEHLSGSIERRSSAFGSNINFSYLTSTFNIFNSKPNIKDIDKETISRLLCAVSFGYGLLQLGISLLPPSMLRLTNFLGFGGNRKSGLENLMFARLGSDMRAPFATLALLWYHTIVRPFFALDGNNVEAGVEAAARLIEETKEEYGESALFLFFKGRVERLCSDIPRAIIAFQTSIENAAQKEIKMMSLHEVGWCYFIQLDFSKSEATFSYLKQSSRWSGPFYSYLTIICAGSNHKFQDSNDIKELRHIFQPVPKGTQLDEFLNRRYKTCPMDEDELRKTSCLFWKLFAYELLYLWNTLPSCTNESLHSIISDCQLAEQSNYEPIVGLAKLVEGSCCCILRRSNEGMDNFRACLEQRKNLPYNSDTAHVSAFAQYELGLLLIRNEQTLAEGKRLLQLVAYNYKDYDFEQRLSVRVHAILKSI